MRIPTEEDEKELATKTQRHKEKLFIIKTPGVFVS
jgi:hypothetical protein